MAVDPKFKEVGSYEADAPLDRQLDQLEQNVARSFGNVATDALSRLRPTRRQTADYVAKLDELVPVTGTLSVTLPAATATNSGRPVAIEVDEAVVTVRSVSSNVQGETSEQLITNGLYLYWSDGVGWWRTPAVTSVTVGDGLTGGGTGDIDIGLDEALVVTAESLNAAVADIRRELEKLRVVLIQLVKVELNAEVDRGVEGLDA